MSFDATNPEHHNHFTQLVLKAFTNEWLGNAMQQSQAKEGRPLTTNQEQEIRDLAEQQFYEWLAEIYDNGYTGDWMTNPYRKENK